MWDYIDQSSGREAPTSKEIEERITKSEEVGHNLLKEMRIIKNNPKDQAIGDIQKGEYLFFT